MKKEKEIGNLVREKIAVQQQTLETPLWNRIEETLKREKRRKRFFYWSLNGVAFLMIGFGVYFYLTTKDSQNKNSVVIVSDELEKNATTLSTTVNTKKDSLLKNNETANKVSSIVDVEDDKPKMTLQKDNYQKVNISNKHEITQLNKKSAQKQEINTPTKTNSNEQVAQRTEKMYYYYNSKTGQEFQSRDKSVIDSLMKANLVKKDTLE